MKNYNKKIIIIVVVAVSLACYAIYSKLSLKSALDNTISYYDKINYNTNIKLKISNKDVSSTINYNCVKSGNIEEILIENTENKKIKNRILKLRVKTQEKIETYVYNGEKYVAQKDESKDFFINYKSLKNKILYIKSKFGNMYIVKMKAKDAYNLIYDKEILTNKDTNKSINVTLIVDNKNNFIKNISYTIDDIGKNKMKYKVKIENNDINNNNKLQIPVTD